MTTDKPLTTPSALAIAGLTPCSSCDWPGRLVATIFLQGCPWNCTYCHNPDLIDPRRPGLITWEEVTSFLDGRRGLLDGVVFSGGEPTRQDLNSAISEVRQMGFDVGLHTTGAYPQRFAKLLPLVDWVGFDVKAQPGQVEAITGTANSSATMVAALRHLLNSGVAYQVRTTWGAGVMTRAEADATLAWAQSQGVHHPVLQPVRTQGTRPTFQATVTAATAS